MLLATVYTFVKQLTCQGSLCECHPILLCVLLKRPWQAGSASNQCLHWLKWRVAEANPGQSCPNNTKKEILYWHGEWSAILPSKGLSFKRSTFRSILEFRSVFMEGRKTGEKPSDQGENPQQTQPTGNRTRVTEVEGERLSTAPPVLPNEKTRAKRVIKLSKPGSNYPLAAGTFKIACVASSRGDWRGRRSSRAETGERNDWAARGSRSLSSPVFGRLGRLPLQSPFAFATQVTHDITIVDFQIISHVLERNTNNKTRAESLIKISKPGSNCNSAGGRFKIKIIDF